MYKGANQKLQHAANGFTLKVQSGLARELSLKEQLDSLKSASMKLNEMARLKDYSLYDKIALGQKIQEVNMEITSLRRLKPKREPSIQEFFVYFLIKRSPKHILTEAKLKADRAYAEFNGDFEAFQSHESTTPRLKSVPTQQQAVGE